MKIKPNFTMDELNEMAIEGRRDDGPGTPGWNPDGSAFQTFNQAFIEEFRRNGGTIEGEIGIFDFALITAIGAKSGKPRTIPVAYYTVDDRVVIIASMGGSDRNPPWYYNVAANPEITVEIGTETFTATAAIHEGAEREKLFDGICAQQAIYREYQAQTERPIPIIELKRHD
jgi:deazaflavin-dependent oxidoreductase (nitroreductase family)